VYVKLETKCVDLSKAMQSETTVMLGGRLGRLAARHLPAVPVFPASRWAVTSNFEADQTDLPR